MINTSRDPIGILRVGSSVASILPRLRCMAVLAVVFLCAVPAKAQIGIPYIADGPLPGDWSEGAPRAGAATASQKKIEKPTETSSETELPAAVDTEDVTRTSAAYFFSRWEKRRELKTVDPAAAEALTQELLRKKQSAGWPNFYVYAATCLREARAALRKGNIAQAGRLASFAVGFAPDSPAVHLDRASIYWQEGESVTAAFSFAEALMTVLREPPLLRRHLGNAALAVLVGLLATAGFFALWALYTYLGLAHHDLLHLLPRGARSWQAAFILGVILVSPILFRLGYTGTICVWLVMLGLYLRPIERVGAVLVISVMALMPVAMPHIMRPFAHPGSLAEAVYFGARSMEAVGIEQRFRATKRPTGGQLYVLGLRSLWSGDLKQSRYWLERAEQTDVNSAELQTTLGNVHARMGDRDKALLAYKVAVALDPSHVVARFNQSRVYHLLAKESEASEAFRDASHLDHEKAEQFARMAKTRSRSFVVPEVVPRRLLGISASVGAAEQAALDQIWGWVGGRLKRDVFTVGAVACIMLLVLLGFLRGPLRLANACYRCGQPACRRCHDEMSDQLQCGQCFRAFVHADKKYEQLRIQKEIEGHRYRASITRLTRLMSFIMPGGGHLVRGAIIRGLVFMVVFLSAVVTLLANFDLIPNPSLHGQPFTGLIISGAALLALCTYALSLWDGVRDT